MVKRPPVKKARPTRKGRQEKKPKLFPTIKRDDNGERIHYARKRLGTKIYKIPIDDKGYVPRWAMAQRFQEVGDTSDIDSTEDRVLPAKCTPDEILEWWADPSSCDIEGIDTEDPEIYDVEGIPEEYRESQRRIAVIADPKEQQRIRQILMESFDPQELTEMARNGSFVIRTIKDGGDATGCYWRRQDGVEVPLIEIEDGCTPDGIVHEAVHHSRAVDRNRKGKLRTSYPTDSTGRLDIMKFNRMNQRDRDRILEDEEKLTTAETLVRTREDRVQSGYYDGVEGKNPRLAYKEDRATLLGTPEPPKRDEPRLTGKEARDAVLNGYEYTNIARAKILSRNVKKR